MRLLTARQATGDKKNNGRSPLIGPYAEPINVRYFSITCRLSAARLVNAAEELSKAHETLMLLVLTYTF